MEIECPEPGGAKYGRRQDPKGNYDDYIRLQRFDIPGKLDGLYGLRLENRLDAEFLGCQLDGARPQFLSATLRLVGCGSNADDFIPGVMDLLKRRDGEFRRPHKNDTHGMNG